MPCARGTPAHGRSVQACDVPPGGRAVDLGRACASLSRSDQGQGHGGCGRTAGRNVRVPIVGPIPIADFTLDDAERGDALPLRREADRDVGHAPPRRTAHPPDPGAVGVSAPPPDVEPLPKGFLPKVGPSKAKSYLYPKEEARLMACGDVPLGFRVFYGFLAREGPRAGEAEGFEWRDFDLDHEVVKLDENKTDDPRAWALDPGVVHALRAWRTLREAERAPVGPRDRVFMLREDRAPVRLCEALSLSSSRRRDRSSGALRPPCLSPADPASRPAGHVRDVEPRRGAHGDVDRRSGRPQVERHHQSVAPRRTHGGGARARGARAARPGDPRACPCAWARRGRSRRCGWHRPCWSERYWPRRHKLCHRCLRGRKGATRAAPIEISLFRCMDSNHD